MNILDAFVDGFVIVEATKTHSGKPKPLNYEANRDRYRKFSHKITYVIVDDFPPNQSNVSKYRWSLENQQRRSIARCFKRLNNDDIVLVSDLDEIPNPRQLLQAVFITKIFKRPVCFLQNLFYYYLNENKLIFASELKALLEEKSIERELDYTALSQFLSFEFIPSPRTLIESIKKVPPGYWLLVSENNTTLEKYWRLYTPCQF